MIVFYLYEIVTVAPPNREVVNVLLVENHMLFLDEVVIIYQGLAIP